MPCTDDTNEGTDEATEYGIYINPRHASGTKSAEVDVLMMRIPYKTTPHRGDPVGSFRRFVRK